MSSLTTIRRRKQDRFATISTAVLKDKDLSLKAKALLITIMSLPDDWDFSVRGIESVVKEGREAVYSAIAELVDHGYCRREQKNAEKGKFASVEYLFTEERWAFEPHTGFPHTEEPDTAEPHTGNPPQYKQKLINSVTNKTCKEEAPAKKTVNTRLDPLTALDGSYPFLGLSVADRRRVAASVLDINIWLRVLRMWQDNGWNPVIGNMLDRYDSERRAPGVTEIGPDGFPAHRGTKPVNKWVHSI